ncbi:MAG TPA: TIM barrel protein [Bryobacteraceae bacterium]|jgi:sugar phosphate isomerase/epimerase|nr:TIM barrel protein [Bryobacteraceae bacterium]
MTRRELFKTVGSAALISPLMSRAKAEEIPNPHGHRGMGGAPTAFIAHNGRTIGGPGGANGNLARAARGGFATRPFTEDFFDYCHSLGLGGAEMGLPPLDPDTIRKFRDKVQAYDMHVIFNIPLPGTDAGLDLFDKEIAAAKAAGAYGLHAALTGRRYEQFKTLSEYRENFERIQATVSRAEPVLRKHQLRLAIENHKGWRAVEQAAWMKRLSSEYVGVHFDFGNNVSLLEEPMFTLETLKPWIFSGHIKDMAVEPYEDGFLLSEVPFGEGFLDLKKMVVTLRTKNPDMPLDLEMITRDPLKVPIYTDRYWVSLDEIPGQQVAQMMELIQKHPPKGPLPKTAGLNLEDRRKLEENYNLACIKYARQNLEL